LAVSTVLTEGAVFKVIPGEELTSDKKFLKDLTVDDRRSAGPLHFKHPYPTIQDSEDFDKDYVKDENTDNGEYKAQAEYDSLRHKIKVLIKVAKVAEGRKNEEKKDLDEVWAKYKKNMAQDEQAIANKLKETDDTVLKSVKVTMSKPAPMADPMADKVVQDIHNLDRGGKQVSEKSWWPMSSSWGKKGPTTTTTEPPPPPPTTTTTTTFDMTEIKKAVSLIKQAEKNLKDTEKELAEAEDVLMKLKFQLTAAEEKLAGAHAKVKKLHEKQVELENSSKTADKQVTITTSTMTKDSVAAKKVWDHQKAIVDKLKEKLLEASDKIKAMRAREDKDGGVYPTATKRSKAAEAAEAEAEAAETPKSGANSIALSSAIALAMASIALA